MIEREEVEALIADMHDYSRQEAGLKSPALYENVLENIRLSSYVTTLYIKDKLVAAGGVVPGSLLSGRGTAWALMTNEAQKNPFTFIRRSREQLVLAKAQFGELACYANVKFPTTEGWMRLMRFERVRLISADGERYAEMLYRGP